MHEYDKEVPIEEQVYETLLGDLIPEYSLDWVEDIFVSGHPCHEEYGRMLQAYGRVCQRLGTGEEDEDVEVIVDSLLSHCRIIALEMFRYGRLWEQMQRDTH